MGVEWVYGVLLVLAYITGVISGFVLKDEIMAVKWRYRHIKRIKSIKSKK
jgi:hypothetical protein